MICPILSLKLELKKGLSFMVSNLPGLRLPDSQRVCLVCLHCFDLHFPLCLLLFDCLKLLTFLFGVGKLSLDAILRCLMLPLQVHYPCLKQVHLLLGPLHLLVDLKHVDPKAVCGDLRIAPPPLHRGETILQARLQNPGAAV